MHQHTTSDHDLLTVYWSEASELHHTGVGHPEHNGRMHAAADGVRRAGVEPLLSTAADAASDTDHWISVVHDPQYSNEFREAVKAGARLFHSLDNPVSGGSFQAARAAVGTALRAADDIWVKKEIQRAFVLARPPGHHAERREAMGFCFFNTIACVAERLRALPGIDRVFIFDWDVHHGNGTQHLFETRDDVFYASTHRFPFYPGTGAADEIGHGKGRGFTLNVPFDAEAGDEDYLPAIEKTIVRAIEDYKPNAILISAGFDAHVRDPLGGMRVTDRGFAAMTKLMVEMSNRHCDGRLLSLLEGGYDREGLTTSVAAHVAALI